MINELKIRCFLSVAQTLNFTETGKRLYMSQQAVSKHISNLESDLGFSLLTRTRNEVSLTDAGVRMFAFFEQFICDFDIITADIRSEGGKQGTNISIGYQNWIDFGPALGAAMSEIRKKSPEIHLIGERHTPAKLLSLLEGGQLDIIMLHKRFLSDKPGQIKKELIATPMHIVVSHDNPLNQKEGGYEKFKGQPLIIDSFDDESETAVMLRARKEAEPFGLEPETIIVVPNRDSVYTTAELGNGVFMGGSMAQNKNTAMLKYYDTDVMEMLYCVWRRKDALLENFADILQREYQKYEHTFLTTGRWT